MWLYKFTVYLTVSPHGHTVSSMHVLNNKHTFNSVLPMETLLEIKVVFCYVLTYMIRLQYCTWISITSEKIRSNAVEIFAHVFIKCKLPFKLLWCVLFEQNYWIKCYILFAITLITHLFDVFFIALLPPFVCVQFLFVKTYQCNKQCYKYLS